MQCFTGAFSQCSKQKNDLDTVVPEHSIAYYTAAGLYILLTCDDNYRLQPPNSVISCSYDDPAQEKWMPTEAVCLCENP